VSILNPADFRNVVVCGHGSSGKTTLIDRILVDTKTFEARADVDRSSSICDFDPVEKAHRFTVEPTLVHFEFCDRHFQVIDTPGYPDFIGQTIGVMAGVENALIVINGHSGIEVNSRHVFRLAGEHGLGRFILINKMDDEQVDVVKLVESIRNVWGPSCFPVQAVPGPGSEFHSVFSLLTFPRGVDDQALELSGFAEPLLESIVELDAAVMERYFAGTIPTDDEVNRLLKEAIQSGAVIPILLGSGKTGVGIDEMLNLLSQFGVSPPAKAIQASHRDGASKCLDADPDAPVSAQVIRTHYDPFMQKLNWIRVHSGTLRKDLEVAISSSRKSMKLGHLFQVQADQVTSVEAAVPGQIVAVAKQEDLHTGTSLGDFSFPEWSFPVPVVGLAIHPKTRGDENKLSVALHKMVEEDLTLHLELDAQTQELVMIGLSELHLSVTQDKLRIRDKVEVETQDPKVPYRETIQSNAEGSYRHKKQSGGRGQFGEVHIRMFPLPSDLRPDEWVTRERFPHLRNFHYDADHHFLFVDTVMGGAIPSHLMPAIEKGFHEVLSRGVMAGFPIENLGVEVHFGKHHPVDSSEAAFKAAARQVFRRVYAAAHPCLLEPVVQLEITTPETHVGDVCGDISTRGGRVSATDPAGGGLTVVHAEVPLREVAHYARSLSSMTGGRGSYSMQLSHYAAMPKSVQDQLELAPVEEGGDE
jgi:elongation factor G